MEHTGTYGLLILAWLSQIGVDFCVEPAMQIKRSIGLTRGKNDRVDARRIADYACTNRTKLNQFLLPSQLLLQIKQLLTYRDQQTKIKVSLKNSLKNHNQYEDILGTNDISIEIQGQIFECESRINYADKRIKDLIKSDADLRRNYDLTMSVKGIGPVIAAFMLVTTNNFTSFENGRKYACYCGIAPFDNASGKYRGKTKVSHLANKRLKGLLSSAAIIAYKWDPEIKRYYQRKTKQGKHHTSVMNAVKCKLVNRVFAVVKRQTPFVNIYREKVA